MNRALVAALAGLGCLATSGQIHLAREFLALFAGNELSLGGIFACWFAGIAAGAVVGGRLARNFSGSLSGLMLCIPVMVILQLGLVAVLRSWGEIADMPVGQLPALGSLLLAGLVTITPFAALIGLAFPLACRSATSGADASLVIGSVYVIESAGAIFGGLLVGVVLAGRMEPMVSMGLLSLPALAGAAWVGWSRKRALAVLAAALGAAMVVAWLFGALTSMDHATTGLRFSALRTGSQRIAWSDTSYQHLDLAESAEQFDLYADGKLASSFPDPYVARPRAHLVMTQHPAPQRVLQIGPGFSGFPSAALAHPIEHMDLVSVDPGVLTLVEPHLDPATRKALGDPRVHHHQTDGRRFLSRSSQSWDLIFIDTPDPTTAALNRFYTAEFYSLARARLSPGGVLATRSTSVTTTLGPELADLIAGLRSTLASSFEHVLIVPGQEMFLFASDRPGVLSTSAETLADRYRSHGVADPAFSHHLFEQLVDPDRTADLEAQLEAHSGVPINTDDRPVTYLQSILVWGRMTDDPLAGPMRLLAGLPVWFWFAIVALVFGLLGLGVIPARVPADRAAWRGSLLAIGLVGALGMSLELVLTYAYQALAGRIYQELGLIVAAFMGGLVGGGIWIQRILARRPIGPAGLGLCLLILGAFAAALFGLQSSAFLGSLPMSAAQIWIVLLVFCAGLGTGIVFPLASQIGLRAGRELGSTAGNADAVDHLGAALGAVWTALVLVPVAGRQTTCLLLAFSCVLAGALNLMVSRKANRKTG